MGRKPLPIEIPEQLLEAPEAVQALATAKHALNTLISEYDWLRLKELSVLNGCTVSDIVRTALKNEIECSPDIERLNSEAYICLEQRATKHQRTQTY